MQCKKQRKKQQDTVHKEKGKNNRKQMTRQWQMAENKKTNKSTVQRTPGSKDGRKQDIRNQTKRNRK